MVRTIACKNCGGRWFKFETRIMVDPDQRFVENAHPNVTQVPSSIDGLWKSMGRRVITCATCGAEFDAMEFNGLPLEEKEQQVGDHDPKSEARRKVAGAME